MKDPADSVRTWLYGVLNGTVSYSSATVPVYSHAPKDAAMPYILLASQQTGSEMEESTKDTYASNSTFSIEIYSRSTGNDGTYKAVNSIGNSVLQLVRVRTPITISGYQVISLTMESIITDNILTDSGTVFIKVITINLKIEET